MCPTEQLTDVVLYGKKKEKIILFVITNNLHNATFPSFIIFMFTEEDGTTINNETEKKFK